MRGGVVRICLQAVDFCARGRDCLLDAADFSLGNDEFRLRALQFRLVRPRVDYKQQIIRFDFLIIYHIELNQRPLYVRGDSNYVGADVGVISARVTAAQSRDRNCPSQTPKHNDDSDQPAEEPQCYGS
jgi:hypothetical protein